MKNDLQVVAPAARKAVQTNDKQITKAVETTFGKDAQLKKIDVRTDAGVVVLSGEVPNISVSAKASEMAHRVDGGEVGQERASCGAGEGQLAEARDVRRERAVS